MTGKAVARVLVLVGEKGVRVGDYALINVFDRYGNESGTSGLMLDVQREIVRRLEEAGCSVGLVEDAPNPYVYTIECGGERWTLPENLAEEGAWDKIWETLPEQAKQVFAKLAEEGVRIAAALSG